MCTTRARYDTTTLPIWRVTPVTHTKASHLRRAPPTAYGAAGMASPSYMEAIAAAAAAAAAAMSIRHRRRYSSRTWMPKPRSLATRRPLASLPLTQKRRPINTKYNQFQKSETTIDGPYFSSTYFWILITKKIMARNHGSKISHNSWSYEGWFGLSLFLCVKSY